MNGILRGLCLFALLGAFNPAGLQAALPIPASPDSQIREQVAAKPLESDSQLSPHAPRTAKASTQTSQSSSLPGRPSKHANRILNINFGLAPNDSKPNGILGGPHDVWTLVDVRETSKTALPMADGTTTDVVLELSENDGKWGISGPADIYHAYLYHNCRCVDLSVTLKDLPRGLYEVYVFAHGDAPDQNAAIEIQSGDTTYSGKCTLNDGTYRYRSRDYEEGNQYVKYTIDVQVGTPVVITSKRAGSSLSMFNAIQLKQLKVK